MQPATDECEPRGRASHIPSELNQVGISDGRPQAARRSYWLATLAIAAAIGLAAGCQSERGLARSADGAPTKPDEDWKSNRTSTEGTDFSKVPPGQTIAPASLGVDLP
jgi:hypothetical protein